MAVILSNNLYFIGRLGRTAIFLLYLKPSKQLKAYEIGFLHSDQKLLVYSDLKLHGLEINKLCGTCRLPSQVRNHRRMRFMTCCWQKPWQRLPLIMGNFSVPCGLCNFILNSRQTHKVELQQRPKCTVILITIHFALEHLQCRSAANHPRSSTSCRTSPYSFFPSSLYLYAHTLPSSATSYHPSQLPESISIATENGVPLHQQTSGRGRFS